MMFEFIGQKRRYRAHRARVAQLPKPYATVASALERYVFIFGPADQWPTTQGMLDDLVELFEQGVADGVPVRSIVGDDPAEFAEEFMSNYPVGQWIKKERDRLSNALADAEKAES